MKVNSFVVCAFFALSLVISSSIGVQVTEETEKNHDVITSTITSETNVMKVNLTDSVESRTDEVETTEIIPPTLMNARVENKQNSTSEKLPKIVDSLPIPRTPLITQSTLHTKSLGHAINSRVKQAFLNSRQNTFERLNHTLPVNSDQVAKPAEVSQVSQDVPKEIPSAPVKKEFYPSAEVNPRYNYESNFNPMLSQYNKGKPDAQFPSSETPYSNELNTNWYVANARPPQDYMSPPQLRNTNIDLRDLNNFHNAPYPGEKFVFPDEKQSSVEHNWSSNHNPGEHIVPALNFKKPKGVWKWIPDEVDSSSPETTTYPDIPQQRPSLLTREHPYSFENFKPYGQKPSWTSEAPITTEDYSYPPIRDDTIRGENHNIHR